MTTLGFVADQPPLLLLPTSSPFLPPIPSISISAPSISTPQSHSFLLYPFLSFTSTFPSFFLSLQLPPLSPHTKNTYRTRKGGGGVERPSKYHINGACFVSTQQVGVNLLLTGEFVLPVYNCIYKLSKIEHKTSLTSHISVSQSIYSIIKVCSNNSDE